MFIFKCYICSNEFPNIHLHIHHKIPRSLGGTDDINNLANLCPQCHDLLHNVAYKLVSKKTSETMLEDMVSLVYDNDLNKIRRCFELAKLVHDEIIKSKEITRNINEYVDISIKIRIKHKNMLHNWAKSCNLSLERFIRSILLKAISDKYAVTIDLHKEEELIKSHKKSGNLI